jgi:LPXTG-motif cell wall-anchored protein
MRSLLAALPALALLALLASPRTLAAQAMDPLSVANAFGDAVDAHNVEAAVAFFADDAVVTTPFNVYTGQEQIRAWLRASVAQNVRSEVVGSRRVTGERVSWLSRIAVDEWRNLGVAPLETRVDAVIRAGKIESITYTFTPEAAARLQAAQARAGAAPAQLPRALPRTGDMPAPAVPVLATGVAVLLAGFSLRRRRGEGLGSSLPRRRANSRPLSRASG